MASYPQRIFFITCSLYLLSCNPSKRTAHTTAETNPGSLKFLGEKDVPYNLAFNGTTVGGLSGIDYDTAAAQYYLISDDRSAINPARFYTAVIAINEKGIDSVYFTAVHYMLQAGGKVYPSNKQDAYHTPDPEAIRFNAANKTLVWSSEGERIVNKTDTVLENPTVIQMSVDGTYRDSFTMPPNLLMQAVEKGPRQNGVLEGMTFADNYNTLFVNVEEPLYEDGPRAAITENNAFIRILKFDVAIKKNTAQYAYKLSPIAHEASPATAFKINGVPDILYIGNNKLLVIERSFSSGRMACTIKLFMVDLNNATDVSGMALSDNQNFKPADKKLLLNMDDLGIYIDNVEGVTFGPVLPNGHKTLVFVADNNFNAEEKTQFFLFEVMP